MSTITNYQIGVSAEQKAKDYLASNGYEIIVLRYKKPCGEVDIIAKKEQILVFCEVKSRKFVSFDSPLSKKQMLRISNTAEVFLAENSEYNSFDIRFDYILLHTKQSSQELQHIQNAWRLDELV